MSTFLLCALDSPGHLFPMIGLASELTKQGHRVAFATDQGRAEYLRNLGFERIKRGLRDGGSFQLPQWYEPWSIAIQVKHIEYAIDQLDPDVIVGQSLAIGPFIAAERREIPLAVLGFLAYLFPVASDAGGPESSVTKARLAWRQSRMTEILNHARRMFRLPPYPEAAVPTILLGDLFLLRSIPDLEPRAHLLPERVCFAGSCLWEPDDSEPELEQWLSETATEPLIYVQHGRSFDLPRFWPDLVEAFSGNESGFRITASIGRMDGEIGELPANFFARRTLPQGRLIRSSNAVITGANTTAVLGGITAGVPLLLIPGGGEQPDVAELCEKAGIARVVQPAEVSPTVLRKELEELLLNERYKERATHLAGAFALVDTEQRPSSVLSLLARSRSPVSILQ